MSSHLNTRSHVSFIQDLLLRTNASVSHVESLVQKSALSLDDTYFLVDMEPHYVGCSILYFESYQRFEFLEKILLDQEEEYTYQVIDTTGKSHRPVLAFMYTIRNKELDPIFTNLAHDRTVVIIREATPSVIKSYARWWIKVYQQDLFESYVLAVGEQKRVTTSTSECDFDHPWLFKKARFVWAEQDQASDCINTLYRFLCELPPHMLVTCMVDNLSTARRTKYSFSELTKDALTSALFTLGGCFIQLLPGKEDPQTSATVTVDLDDSIQDPEMRINEWILNA